MKMYLRVQLELSELHQRFKSANPTAGDQFWIGAGKGKRINLSLQSDTQWKSLSTNDSFISALQLRWARQMIGVQTGSSGLRFSHRSMDKCHRQRSGRCWGAWRCSFGKSDRIWQCAFSPPHYPRWLLFFPSKHPPPLISSHTPKSAVFVVSPNTPHFSSQLSSQRTRRAWCLSSLSVSLSLSLSVVLRLILPSSETWCMCICSTEAHQLQLWRCADWK